MTDPIRALCAELTEKLHEHTSLYDGHESELVARARTLLAQPEPEGLTDEELLKVFLDAKAADMARQGGLTSSDANGIARQLDAQTVAGLRAVLAADRAHALLDQPEPEGLANLRNAAEQARQTLEGWANYGEWVWPESALEQAKINTTETLTSLNIALAQPNPPAKEFDDKNREAVITAVAEALGGNAYDCLRVWSAWGCGTMGEDDFRLVADDDDRVAEIADAAIEAIHPTPQPPVDGEVAGLVAALKVIDKMQNEWILLGNDDGTASPSLTMPISLRRFTVIRDALTRAAELLQCQQPQPVPVSERPWEREGWCDDRGRCWYGAPDRPGAVACWDLEYEPATDDTHSLPAHALPLP